MAQHTGTLTPGDWDNLQLETAAFANSLVFWERIPKQYRNHLRACFGRPQENAYLRLARTPGDPPWIPERDDIDKIKGEFRRILVELTQKGVVHQKVERTIRLGWSRDRMYVPARRSLKDWEIELGGEDRTLWMYPRFPFHYGRTAVEKTINNFYELLANVPHDLLRLCPEDHEQRFFVAHRANQQFCSPQCQARAAVRAYRKRQRPKQKRNSRK